MSYEKQTWKTGDVITAERLNHIEDGINVAGGDGAFVINIVAGSGFSHNLDKTWNEIKSAAQAGQVCLVCNIVDDITNIYFINSIYHDSNGYTVVVDYKLYTSETADGVLAESGDT